MNFWDKSLDQLTQHEWEQLCDGCGLCCMHKFENEDINEVYFTSIACRMFDTSTCRCTDYKHRCQRIQGCLDIRCMQPRELAWLPATCAYRLRFEGKPLCAWHPLVSGQAQTVHTAGISVKNRCTPENNVPEEVWLDYLLQ